MPGREDRDVGVAGGRNDNGSPAARPVVYCLIPRDLAPRLHEQLRRHFARDPLVQVVVERRAEERRSGSDRRSAEAGAEGRASERRRIRAVQGRRVAERRGALVAVDALGGLPRRARAHADRLVFVERIEPRSQVVEDADTARLVARIQAGDRDAFALLYMRYFDRVYGYLRMVLADPHAAEDAAQQVFVKVLGGLPRYQRRRQPFRAWLFVIARNEALGELRKQSRVELTEPAELEDARAAPLAEEPELGALHWISDSELLMLIERLPLAQQQVLMLRYALDLSHAEIAQVLGRTPEDARILQHRALRFLQARLAALGRETRPRGAPHMRRTHKHALIARRRRFALLHR
jgi:RNA polymerase sigma-70 factor (ECF subfamily)